MTLCAERRSNMTYSCCQDLLPLYKTYRSQRLIYYSMQLVLRNYCEWSNMIKQEKIWSFEVFTTCTVMPSPDLTRRLSTVVASLNEKNLRLGPRKTAADFCWCFHNYGQKVSTDGSASLNIAVWLVAIADSSFWNKIEWKLFRSNDHHLCSVKNCSFLPHKISEKHQQFFFVLTAVNSRQSINPYRNEAVLKIPANDLILKAA